jgi:dienelactone hydrolase
MAEVVLFHHVRGLTDGVRALAGDLSASRHRVHTPDIFEGERPAAITDGFLLTQSIGGEVLRRRADQVVAELPQHVVYAGSPSP